MIISRNKGPIPLFLSGCSIGSGSNGIETGSYLQKAVQQQYSLRQYWAIETWYPQAITFLSKMQLIGKGPDCASRCVRVKITGLMGIGSCIVARGLGHCLVQGNLGYGPYHRAKVQGPKGLGDSVSYSFLSLYSSFSFFLYFISLI